jgi:hypothetical protein
MSKIVVGMNSSPAIIPQRIDCGLRKTRSMARPAALTQSSCRGDGFDAGRRKYSTTLIARPATPMNTQNVLHAVPELISGPTRNWPADPPAMPNICVAPMSVAAREGGKLVVTMYTAPTSAKTPPAPCRKRPTLAAVPLPVAKSRAPIPTVAAPRGTTPRGPIRSIAAPATRLNGE